MADFFLLSILDVSKLFIGAETGFIGVEWSFIGAK